MNYFVIWRLGYCNSILWYDSLRLKWNAITSSEQCSTSSYRNQSQVPFLKTYSGLLLGLALRHFKILHLSYIILNGQSPTYLPSLLNCYKPLRSLHYSGRLLRQRTFSFCTPKLWDVVSLYRLLRRKEGIAASKLRAGYGSAVRYLLTAPSLHFELWKDRKELGIPAQFPLIHPNLYWFTPAASTTFSLTCLIFIPYKLWHPRERSWMIIPKIALVE